MGWGRMQEQNLNACGLCSSPDKRSGDRQPSQDQTCLGNGNTCAGVTTRIPVPPMAKHIPKHCGMQ